MCIRDRSGKDSTKVDRSGAYMARYIAKNIVSAGLADRCTVTLAYAIGKAEPVAVNVDTDGTGEYRDEVLEQAVQAVFDLTPAGMRHTQMCIRDRLTVMAYVMTDGDRWRSPALPSEYYYQGIREGYRQNGLPLSKLKQAWQHCAKELDQESSRLNRICGGQAKSPKKQRGNER